ncbi:MAG TPA: hypothetical protein VJW20_16335 [Candidatus Angelobacter sp.]|nr:hypothetical protein [Candidatus Angelobacter sp.]
MRIHKFRSGFTRVFQLFFLLIAPLLTLSAQQEGRQVSVGDAVTHALQQSKLTVADGTPFHLQAHIAVTDKSHPEYAADVEEYWVSPEKWRRTIKSSNFSQTLIANGNEISETLTGDYYPFWLHDLVTALFDPLPMAEQLKHMSGQLEIPEDSTQSNSCLNLQSRVGIAPVQNTVGYAFCFGGKLGLLHAAVTPGYRAQFADYQPFKKKLVARTITADFTPGLTLSAKITELTEIANPDAQQFAIDKATPAAEQIKSSQVGEDSARALALNTPEIVWPALREGKTSGVLSLYISTDRSGHVREAWPLGSADPQLVEAARRQVLRWQYKPYINNGASQMEAVLTFAFSTKIEDPIAVLTNAQARKLAIRTQEPVIAPGKAKAGTKFTLRASVDEAGKVQSVLNLNNTAPALYSAGAAALKKWGFRPYLNQGKPDRFYADIIFLVR